MRRPYSTLQFADAMNMARQVVPGVGITTDVIVGFPGETEYEFEESLSFLRAAGFARIHVFPYSRREGTAAASLPAQINDDDKRVRSAKVQAVAEASAARFAAQFSGCTLPVLWENKSSDEQENEYWSGYTDNYIRVMTENGSNLQNVITETRLSFSPSGTAFGEILDR
jgi:threonylcarbamoyladenosine tRNA methylthiotransferase MtaB